EDIPQGDVIISLSRFQTDGDRLLGESRSVGVRLETHESAEVLAYDLPRLAIVEVNFGKFTDGRGFSTARLLRERYKFPREIRAVGDVLRHLAPFLVRIGFDGFEPADGSTPEQWARSAARHRHVYQRAADSRAPAYAERGAESCSPSLCLARRCR